MIVAEPEERGEAPCASYLRQMGEEAESMNHGNIMIAKPWSAGIIARTRVDLMTCLVVGGKGGNGGDGDGGVCRVVDFCQVLEGDLLQSLHLNLTAGYSSATGYKGYKRVQPDELGSGEWKLARKEKVKYN